ncbi:MAG: transposase [Candidatus Nitrosocosmicus sp.]
MNEKLNHLGIDVAGKRKCRAAVKDDKGNILDEFFFDNDAIGIGNLLSRVKINGTRYTTTQAVLESTDNMWMRIHDTLEENAIDTVLANPYKTL